MVTFTDLAEDLVPVYSSGFTGDEEVEFEIMADAEDEFERELPSDTDHWF